MALVERRSHDELPQIREGRVSFTKAAHPHARPLYDRRASIMGRASLDDGLHASSDVYDLNHEGRYPFMIKRIDAIKARASGVEYGIARPAYRVWINPFVIAIAFIGMLALGSGMIEPLIVEARARSAGIWFRASCEIEDQLYVSESHKVGKSHNVASAIQKGATIWTFFGAYRVTVTLADGCDGRKEHLLDAAEMERIEQAEMGHGYFVIDIDHDSQLEGDVEVNVEDSEDDSSAAGGKDGGSGGGANAGARQQRRRRLLADATDGGGTNSTHRPHPTRSDAELAALCTAREANLDHLRGEHLAYSDLVLQNGDMCTGPVNATREEGEAFCDSTVSLWLRWRPSVGEHVPCWAFEKRLPNGRGYEVHIVLNRNLSTSIRLYVLYATLVFSLLLRLIYLLSRRWLQARGLLAPDVIEPVQTHARRPRNSLFSRNPTRPSDGTSFKRGMSRGVSRSQSRREPLKRSESEVPPSMFVTQPRSAYRLMPLGSRRDDLGGRAPDQLPLM